MSTPRRITVPQFSAMKAAGQKIVMLTAYDHAMAALVDQSGVDAILVGDTLSMVVQGHETTLRVTLAEMIYHAEMVSRAVSRALVVVDMPFPTNHLGPYKAVAAAARIMKESGCHAVKLEGGADQAAVIASLVSAGIPVMAHCGLRPQSVHVLGGYKVQRDAQRLMADAKAVEAAGAFSLLLECIPEDLASDITRSVDIPTIGIGAGRGCDGQILVLHDMLGLTSGHVPKFVKPYADLKKVVRDAVTRYGDDVRGGQFPGPEQTFR